jgi:hypothetical protein
MLGAGKTEAVRAFVAARSARSQDADLYRRYAAALYRHALLTRGDPSPAEHVVYDVLVNEAALARIPEGGEDDAHYRPTGSVLRRFHQLAAGAVAISPRDMTALLHAVMSGAGILISRRCRGRQPGKNACRRQAAGPAAGG